jgi:hypothetical protein
VLEYKIKAKEVEPPTRNCSEKVEYFNYVVNKQKNTEEALRQLQESDEYKLYLANKNNPNSRYNRKDEEIEEIVLSDDSDEPQNEPRRSKYD